MLELVLARAHPAHASARSSGVQLLFIQPAGRPCIQGMPQHVGHEGNDRPVAVLGVDVGKELRRVRHLGPAGIDEQDDIGGGGIAVDRELGTLRRAGRASRPHSPGAPAPSRHPLAADPRRRYRTTHRAPARTPPSGRRRGREQQHRCQQDRTGVWHHDHSRKAGIAAAAVRTCAAAARARSCRTSIGSPAPASRPSGHLR